MKQLNTAIGNFGPFNSITRLMDRWVCDTVHYSDGIVGFATVSDYVVAPVIVPAPPATPQVTSITMAQFETALHDASVLNAVETYISGANKKRKIAWNRSTVVTRDSQLVTGIINNLNWTDVQMDQLFTTASILVV